VSWGPRSCRRSPGITTFAAVQDYAETWMTERGRCHRFVYVDGDGRPANCPEPPATSGWRRDGQAAGTPSTSTPATPRSFGADLDIPRSSLSRGSGEFVSEQVAELVGEAGGVGTA